MRHSKLLGWRIPVAYQKDFLFFVFLELLKKGEMFIENAVKISSFCTVLPLILPYFTAIAVVGQFAFTYIFGKQFLNRGGYRDHILLDLELFNKF